MSKDILVRDVPPHVARWIEKEMARTGLKQTEFMRAVLDNAYRGDRAPTLFDLVAPDLRVIPAALPFKFIDLFAGVGGFRIGLSKVGGRCVFSSEIDTYARRTYSAWFKEPEEEIFGDINQLTNEEEIQAAIPDHDILGAGFPCQPFSLAGVSKRQSLGRSHGFECKTQGNLFFKIVEVVRVKRPPVLVLENVKNLKSHDKGRTWKIIEATLEEDLNYKVFSKIIDASSWVPQHRERCLIVAFDREVFGGTVDFVFPEPHIGEKPTLSSILQPDPPHDFVLTDKLWKYLQDYAAKHRRKGNGFGFGLFDGGGRARTLSARYYKDGSEILIKAPEGGFVGLEQEGKSKDNPRKLTIRECARLMGFHEDNAAFFGHDAGFPQVVSNTQAYKQFGNGVVPAVIEAVAENILPVLNTHIHQTGNGCLLKGATGRKAAIDFKEVAAS